ncbi:MAG: phenylalanine--tRNA ligase subunit alpha [Candidatus Cloacimonadota bacterium]|nr:MAG: phenylalanine--tRNA ligase subunit alpha [Candidatus Cloacimonadota bacterium]
MKAKLEQLTEEAKKAIENSETIHDLLNIKSRFTGKKSELNQFMKQMGSLPKEERPAFGKLVNDAKQIIAGHISEKEEKIKEAEYKQNLLDNKVDIFRPGRKRGKGGLHPITKVWREIEDVFIGMGFQVAEGFDIEDEYHNFDALNTPENHPARNLSDTFYIDKDVLLRTQTSTVQIRTMEEFKLPIRIVSPGRCYRNDNDATHSPAFHQVELLVVEEGANFVHLREVMDTFVRSVFGEEIGTRVRPHFFPFTEPSAEIDINCVKCHGAGCSLCKESGWLEMGGAGMVDPNVFDMVGIDSEKYSGYAFGMGLDRIAMLKYHIPDMRLLFQNDIRFLRQFK